MLFVTTSLLITGVHDKYIQMVQWGLISSKGLTQAFMHANHIHTVWILERINLIFERFQFYIDFPCRVNALQIHTAFAYYPYPSASRVLCLSVRPG